MKDYTSPTVDRSVRLSHSFYNLCRSSSDSYQRVDVFTRKEYRDIILESITHCQNESGLLVHAWCTMSNHLYLVMSAKNHDLSDILCDFKKFTSTNYYSY